MRTLSTLRADGADITALCKLAGIPVGDGQQRILDEVFATAPDGIATNPEYHFAASQADVTSALQRCALGWLYLASQPRILWTTADAPTARDNDQQQRHPASAGSPDQPRQRRPGNHARKRLPPHHAKPHAVRTRLLR